MIRTGVRSAIGLALLCGAAPTFAQSAPAAPETLRLTPEEKADILSHQTEASVDAARAGPGGGKPQIHGEIGAAIGSRSGRAVYGTAAIPLGDNARAAVSFEDSRSPHR